MATAKRKPIPKALKAVHEALMADRADLLHQMEELERSSEGQEPNVEADAADVGSATSDRERNLSVAENLRDLLDQVDHALGRVEAGTYGACESCGKKIEAARLKALPYATLCISCKRRLEGRR